MPENREICCLARRRRALRVFALVLAAVIVVGSAAPINAQTQGSPAGGSHSSLSRVCDTLGGGCKAAKYAYWGAMSLIPTKSRDGLYWMYLVALLGMGALIYARGLPRFGDFSVQDCLRFMFPRRVYLHPSAITDAKYYLSTAVADPLMNLLIAGGAALALTSKVAGWLTAVLGPVSGPSSPGWVARMTYTVFLVVAIDLGYFIFHYLSHRIAFLWEFHKVHHAAEVLTPLTGYRNHPVDNLVQQLTIGFTVAVLNGAMVYMYQRPPDIITILDTSAVLFVYNMTANIRHSHMWLAYGNLTSHILSSPAQHQIHHSYEDRHIDMNFGRVLSVWDWMAGTLYVPKGKEEFRLGLKNEEHKDYLTLWGCYALPFIKAFRRLTRQWQPARAATEVYDVSLRSLGPR